MSAAAKLPFVSVMDAQGRTVGNGRGLEGAREDAVARRVRVLEVRAGRPLRAAELAEVEQWAAGLWPADDKPAPPHAAPPADGLRLARHLDAQGQVLLFPAPAPFTDTGAPTNPAPRRCAGCRAALPPYLGRGCPRRFCLTCRPRLRPLAVADQPRPPRARRWRLSGATGGQGLLWPELAGACLGCGASLAPYPGVGRPRRWCARCRPARPHQPARAPRVGDRVRVAGDELLVVARRRLQGEGRRWQGAVEVRRPNGLQVVIPLADWRAMSVEVLLG